MKERIPANCPKHGKDMLARKDDKIICLVYECDYSVPARRKEDSEIETFNNIRAKWQ
jgi:hypothetical protein